MLLHSRYRFARSLCPLLLCAGLMVALTARADAPPSEPTDASLARPEDATVNLEGAAGAEVEANAASPPPAPVEQPRPADLERARQLFQRGLQLAEREDFAGAAKSFSEALALRDAPAVEYNLAAALAELQQYQEAYNRTQRVLASPNTAESVRERAKQLELSLQARVARLTVVTSGTENDLMVSIDGQVLDPASLGRAQAVAPGVHEIVATRAGATISSRSVEIPLRTAALVDVSLVVTELEQDTARMEVSTTTVPLTMAKAPPRVDGDGDGDAAGRRTRRRWIGIAAGVLATSVAVTVGVLMAKSDGSRQEPLQGDTGVLIW